jgi:hypothetical protein
MTDAAALDEFSDDDQGVGFGLDDLLPVRVLCPLRLFVMRCAGGRQWWAPVGVRGTR